MPNQNNQQLKNNQLSIAHALDFVSHGTFTDCEQNLATPKRSMNNSTFTKNISPKLNEKTIMERMEEAIEKSSATNNKLQGKTILERMDECIAKDNNDNSNKPLLSRVLPDNINNQETAKEQLQAKADQATDSLKDVQQHFKSAAFQSMDFVDSTLEDAKSTIPNDTKNTVAETAETAKGNLEELEQHLESAVFQTMDFAESTLEDATSTIPNDTKEVISEKAAIAKDSLEELEQHLESAVFQTMDIAESTLEDADSAIPDDTKEAISEKAVVAKDSIEELEQHLESAVFQTMDIAESTLEDATSTIIPNDDTKEAVVEKVGNTAKESVEHAQDAFTSATFQSMDFVDSPLEEANNALSTTTSTTAAIKIPSLFDKKEEDKSTLEQIQEALTGVKEENKGLITRAKEQWNTTDESSNNANNNTNPLSNLLNVNLFDKKEEDKATIEQIEEAITGVKEENKGLITKAKEQWNGETAEENKGILQKGADALILHNDNNNNDNNNDHVDIVENLEQVEQHIAATL